MFLVGVAATVMVVVGVVVVGVVVVGVARVRGRRRVSVVLLVDVAGDWGDAGHAVMLVRLGCCWS